MSRIAKLVGVLVLLLGAGVVPSAAPAVADPNTCVRGNGKVYGLPVEGFGTLFGYVLNNHCGGHFYARIEIEGRYSNCQYVGATHGYLAHPFNDSYYTVHLCSSGPRPVGGAAASGCGQWLRRIYSFGRFVYVGRNVCSTRQRLQAVLTGGYAAHPKLGCIVVPAHEFAFWDAPVVDNAKIARC